MTEIGSDWHSKHLFVYYIVVFYLTPYLYRYERLLVRYPFHKRYHIHSACIGESIYMRDKDVRVIVISIMVGHDGFEATGYRKRLVLHM
jgi:hypothetical protein